MGGRSGRRLRLSTAAAGWDWLLRHGRLKQRAVVAQSTLPDGTNVTWFQPLSERRGEVQDLAERAYDEAASLAEKATVVRDYVSHFPQLAFDPDSWFWDVYWTARARRSVDDLRLLGALARGTKAPAPGWMPKKRWRASRLQFAKRRRNELKRRSSWQTLYHHWRESRSLGKAAREGGRRQYLVPLIREIKAETGYQTSENELSQIGLADVLSKAVSKQLRIRERNLHDATD